MTANYFRVLKQKVMAAGYEDEIEWQRTLQPCETDIRFAEEAIWVILNSGMREQIARGICNGVYKAIGEGQDISEVFGHKGKVAAIKYVLENKDVLFEEYLDTEDKIEMLLTIPYIGKITCWHLAKNLGTDCAQPDRHLVRIASGYGMTPEEMCKKLRDETGEKICVVDIIIWRACNLKFI